MYTATYSPDDNKLRLYASRRLDAETYARVKAAGFSWAPKQDLFVAPMWTPEREDLLLELAGEIDDEDTSLVERAEERADRFEGYSEKRGSEAARAREAVSAIADNIPLGQPILIGHHSERHARRDQERIENGMRKAVKLWRTSGYWKSRAEGAVRAAKYKERPDVRARRIKKLEAEQRKQQKYKSDAENWLKLWSSLEKLHNDPDKQLAQARAIANHSHLYVVRDESGALGWTAWDVLRPDGERYSRCPAWTVSQVIEAAKEAYPRQIERADRWLAHYANRLEYERAMLADAGGTIADQKGPEKGGACKCWASPRGGWSYIQKVNKVSVTVKHTWGHGQPFTITVPFDKLAGVMTAAEVRAARDEGRLIEDQFKIGFGISGEPTRAPAPAQTDEADAGFRNLEEQLKDGVKVAVAPQLFPTPPDLAARMVEMASIDANYKVLEPSAGTDAIWRHLSGARVAVEINPKLAERLRDMCTPRDFVVCQDFLECDPENLGSYDRIVMNPPFVNAADIKHIEHARRFLKPGGRIVAICADGPRQNQKLRPIATTWETLPPDTFKDQGTSVRTVLLTIEAPAIEG